jgi:hypothetical protein
MARKTREQGGLQEHNGDRDFGAPPGERPDEGDDDPVREENGKDGETNDATAPPPNDAKKPKKTQEEKRSDFSRLASGRVSRAIDALSSLLHLANTSSYDWMASDRVRIFTALREKIDTVEASFAAAEQPTEGKKKTARQLSFRV